MTTPHDSDNTIHGGITGSQLAEDIKLTSRYRLVRKLGSGGMGEVWLAQDEVLDRPVAIKTLPLVLAANKRALKQLKQEAQLAIQLSHPNIVTLRTFEEAEDGTFLVMDAVDGRSLDDLLAERDVLPEDEVRRIFTAVAAALDYAHSKKIVHRDLKPSNIMVAADGTPLVTDFGVARQIKDTMTRVTGKSASGTLPYMSPEQLNGDPPTPAQDIYGLAATMYECLAGHSPFQTGQIEHQILNVMPAPPGTSPLAKSVMQGLAKNPDERPTTAAALVGDYQQKKMRVDSLNKPLLEQSPELPVPPPFPRKGKNLEVDSIRATSNMRPLSTRMHHNTTPASLPEEVDSAPAVIIAPELPTQKSQKQTLRPSALGAVACPANTTSPPARSSIKMIIDYFCYVVIGVMFFLLVGGIIWIVDKLGLLP